MPRLESSFPHVQRHLEDFSFGLERKTGPGGFPFGEKELNFCTAASLATVPSSSTLTSVVSHRKITRLTA